MLHVLPVYIDLIMSLCQIESNAFWKSIKQAYILVDMFIYQGVWGVNMISRAMFWCKSNLAFTQDIVLIGYCSHKVVSVLQDWGYESLIPDVREITYTRDQIKQFYYSQLKFCTSEFEHLI